MPSINSIRTADNTDGMSRKSIVSEKSPPFRPALKILPLAVFWSLFLFTLLHNSRGLSKCMNRNNLCKWCYTMSLTSLTYCLSFYVCGNWSLAFWLQSKGLTLAHDRVWDIFIVGPTHPWVTKIFYTAYVNDTCDGTWWLKNWCLIIETGDKFLVRSRSNGQAKGKA